MKKFCLIIAVGFIFLAASTGCNHKARTSDEKVAQTVVKEEILPLIVQSSAFTARAVIPKEYTCDGEDLSPDLNWADPPVGVESFAIICDDPDAPGGDWVHWVIYDIPSDVRSVPKGIDDLPTLPDGSIQGRNDFNRIGYNGPCPPSGKPHRYQYKLYALDKQVGLPLGATKTEILKVIKGHIKSEGLLIGTYKRSN